MNNIERAAKVICADLRRGLYSAEEAGRVLDAADAIAVGSMQTGLSISDDVRHRNALAVAVRARREGGQT